MQTKTNSKSFIKGAAALSLASLLVKIFGVMYKIPLARFLLDDGMSYFNSAYTVYSFFFILCSAGVPKAITIIISTTSKLKEKSESDVLFTSLSFFFALGTILSLLFMAFAVPISDFIGSKKIVYSMIAISPSIPFIASVAVFRGYLTGRLKFARVAISQCIEAVLKLVIGLALAYVATRNGCSREIISAYAITGITVGSIITFTYLMIAVKRINKRDNIRQNGKFSFGYLKTICSISMPVTASAALMSLVNVIDLTIIMRGLDGIGYGEYVSSILYGNYTTLAVPMFNFALSITTSICTSLLPVLTESASKGNYTDFSSHLHKAVKLSAFVAAPATLVFMCLPKETLTVLFERESVAVGAFLLSVLSFSVIIIAALTVINTALEAIGRYDVVLCSMIVGSIVKLASSYFLIGKTELALWGAPIGTASSYIVSLAISAFAYKVARITGGVFKPFLRFGVLAVLSAIIIAMLKRSYPSVVLTPFLSLVTLAIYGAIYLFCVVAFSFITQKRAFV